MERLSKEALLEPASSEPVELKLPGKAGSVLVKPLVEWNDFQEMSRKLDAAKVMARFPKHPLHGLSDELIAQAGFISAGLVEPGMTVEEAAQWLNVGGYAPRLVSQRILELTGISEEAVQERDSALEADTFPAECAGGEPGTSAPTPERDGTEPL